MAIERGTTYVLMGTPRARNALRRLTAPALPFRLLQLLPGVDLRIVADRSRRTPRRRMTAVLHHPADLAILARVLGTLYARDRRQRARRSPQVPTESSSPSPDTRSRAGALDAALRLALADHATLVPVFLVRVPMQLGLDSPLPRQCSEGLPLLETIEQRAATLGVTVDARVDRGRTLRHAMRQAMTHEHFDRLVVAAASARSEGFGSEDIAWLLDHAPGEVVIVRPGGDDRIRPGGRSSSAHRLIHARETAGSLAR